VTPISPESSIGAALERVLTRFVVVAITAVVPPSFAVTTDEVVMSVDHGVTTFTVESPRPLASAARELVSRYGLVISYEDPAYAYGEDLQDVTRHVAKGAVRFIPGTVIVPKGGKLAVRVESTDAAVILERLVQAQSKSGSGGRFRIEQTGDAIHIIPVANMARDGTWVAVSSILDVPISLPTEDRTDYQLIDEICSAISAASNVRVAQFSWLQNGIFNPDQGPPRFRFGAKNEAARNVLMRALTAIAARRQKMTWSLLYDTSPGTGPYILNIVPVPTKDVIPAPVATPRPSSPSTAPEYHGTGIR